MVSFSAFGFLPNKANWKLELVTKIGLYHFFFIRKFLSRMAKKMSFPIQNELLSILLLTGNRVRPGFFINKGHHWREHTP